MCSILLFLEVLWSRGVKHCVLSELQIFTPHVIVAVLRSGSGHVMHKSEARRHVVMTLSLHVDTRSVFKVFNAIPLEHNVHLPLMATHAMHVWP